ncbi:cell division protein ZapA, partial [Methylobacterium crusticola]|uniref:cell division protein ZapA n=1 Tax=Methylobacterium crusticola TaxID=1697972 RepID=UPI001EE26E16
EEVERCARFLDENISEVHRRGGLMDAYKATILAALSITAQYFEAQDDLADVRARMALRSSSLADDVEAELTEDAGS